jgi:hypothetical protein
MIFLYEVIKCKIREEAGVGDAKEKKDLFDRKSKHIAARSIPRIKPPHPEVGEERIPRNKKEGGDGDCRQNEFPFPGKIRRGIKTENERDDK